MTGQLSPGGHWPQSAFPKPYQRSGPKRHIRAVGLECGHQFRTDIPPQRGERVWCWTCDDYRRAGTQRSPLPRRRSGTTERKQDGSSH